MQNSGNVARRDIAAESYAAALKYLENEFEGNSKALTWLQNAKSTSLDDLLGISRQAEAKYDQAAQGKRSVKAWIRGLSKRILYYGQVLDTLSQHHPEYVSLVWGMVKFVLMGILNHANLVTQFAQALSIIAQVLPRTEINAELYQTDEMKEAIASLYAHILLFLQQATKWYNVGPAGRALTALFKPFELSYKDTVEQIMLCAQTIDDISSLASRVEIREIKTFLQGESKRLEERETKLHEMQARFHQAQAELSETVDKVLQIITSENRKIDQVHLNVMDMKPRLVDMHFNHVLGVLKPKRSPEDALQKHRSLIRRSSPWRSQNRDTFEIFQRLGQWISAPKTSLLVLQAQPRAQSRVKEIATQLIGTLQPTSKRVIWYLSSISFADLDAVSAIEVLRTLVYQSMKLEPGLVISQPENFNTAKLHASHTESEWFDLLCSILRRLATCFIIVEAEDVFRDEEEANKLVQAFEMLADRFQSAGMAIKLLLVSYGPVRSRKATEQQSNSGVLVVGKDSPVPPRLRKPGSRSPHQSVGWNGLGRRL
ncbi:hypothetical protein PFICI_13852 [Pestalotiopsis fici W106-1]|uniref:DUF7708 domain-containing protein n=1 Tax=Pestalotiopsis fici (strain W106-1 / CGMCC3.15140) TaxID=1229662 RepID=W3WME5_PESFW|nr:uncharacterized protein PFICI_13852 [Pestalotiopsis fici W106-1]ETS73986.1 hypothetical protein PFICI_13852 [Pestalotiopsis fici W106-1]